MELIFAAASDLGVVNPTEGFYHPFQTEQAAFVTPLYIIPAPQEQAAPVTEVYVSAKQLGAVICFRLQVGLYVDGVETMGSAVDRLSYSLTAFT